MLLQRPRSHPAKQTSADEKPNKRSRHSSSRLSSGSCSLLGGPESLPGAMCLEEPNGSSLCPCLCPYLGSFQLLNECYRSEEASEKQGQAGTIWPRRSLASCLQHPLLCLSSTAASPLHYSPDVHLFSLPSQGLWRHLTSLDHGTELLSSHRVSLPRDPRLLYLWQQMKMTCLQSRTPNCLDRFRYSKPCQNFTTVDHAVPCPLGHFGPRTFPSLRGVADKYPHLLGTQLQLSRTDRGPSRSKF